jgi:hypothetical protein
MPTYHPRKPQVRQITRKVAEALIKTGGTVAAVHGNNPNPYMITKKNGKPLPKGINFRYYAYGVNIDNNHEVC